MVLNYQMASHLRLCATPPSIFPRVILPQAPFMTHSDSNSWCAYTRRWLCPQLSNPPPFLLTLSIFYTSVVPLHPCCGWIPVGWVAEKKEKPMALPRPERSLSSQPCLLVDPSRRRYPGLSTLFSWKCLFERSVFTANIPYSFIHSCHLRI